MNEQKISIAVPVHQLSYRWNILHRLLTYAETDTRISEVVLSIEPGEQRLPIRMPKVRCLYNEKREYVFRNKFKAVQACSNEWVVIFDSDNWLDRVYVDTLYKLAPWDKNLVYQPEFLRPKFDCREFTGLTLDRTVLRCYMGRPMFRVMMNAMNYFVNRDEFIASNKESFDAGYDPKCSDSLHVNWNWFRYGHKMLVVKGLQYDHLVHSNSFYKQAACEFGKLVDEAERRLINL
jgi:hypothetical protein